MKEYLLTAGPTPVPERVLLAMARPMLYHRAPAFTECLREVQDGLRWLMQTKQLPLAAQPARARSAMDAAVCNFLRTGDKAVVIRGGKFGERWGKICQAYGIECVFIDVEWGKGVDPKAGRRGDREEPGRARGLRHRLRDLDRDQARRRGDRQGGAARTTTSSSASTRSPRSACSTCRSTSGGSTSWWSARRRR